MFRFGVCGSRGNRFWNNARDFDPDALVGARLLTFDFGRGSDAALAGVDTGNMKAIELPKNPVQLAKIKPTPRWSFAHAVS